MPATSLDIAALADQVWPLVADVTRIGEWSPETVAAEWIDGAVGPAVGARFVGRNHRRGSWKTTCTVTECVPGRSFAFSVGRGETTWAYRLAPTATGCRVTESFEIVKVPGPVGRWLTKLGAGVTWAERESDLVRGMEETLRRLKTAAESVGAERVAVTEVGPAEGVVGADRLDLDGLFAALFSPGGIEDPHRLYRRYPGPEGRYAVAQKLLRDHRFGPADFSAERRPIWRMFGRWLINLDGREHDVMRALAADPFARSMSARYVDVVSGHVERLLDGVEAAAGPVDLLTAVAYPLPVSVICTILGLPDEDRPAIDGWLRTLSLAFARQRQEDMLLAGDAAVEGLTRYLGPILADRRAHPRDDLLSLIARDPTVAFDTVVANAIFLLVAGHDTTLSALCSCVLLLLRHPDQLAAVRADPSLVPGAVEEALRFESPVQIAMRSAREDTEIDGFRFVAGAPIRVLLGAANRDPAVFPDPDRFDVTRQPNPHLSFTAGRHFCLGAPLARLQLVTALSAILRRFPRIELAEEPRWLSAMPLRTLEGLVVSVAR